MTFLSDVAAAIGAAVPTETAVFASNAEPPLPDNLVTLYELGGTAGTLSLSADVQEDRTVQVRIRDKSHEACQTRCAALYEAFAAWSDTPAFLRLRVQSQPVYQYPRDANGRSVASFTLTVLRSV